MKKTQTIYFMIFFVILIVGVSVLSLKLAYPTRNSLTTSSVSGTTSTLASAAMNFTVRLIDSMPLPNVGERFDHMSFDYSAHLIFIAARGNNSVYVVDLITEGVSHIITGLNEPQGVFYVLQTNELYVSNGGDGTVDVFDVGNYSLIKTLSFGSDADNMRFDQNSGLLYVGYGEGNQSGIGIINTNSDSIIGSISLNGHPEAFELEQNGSKIFVNIPTASSIDVLDRMNRKILATWPLTSALANYPMTLDEKDHRLFVGFWYPSQLIVYNTETGMSVATMNISQDADDMFYDPNSHLVLVSCGLGFLDVISQRNADFYELLTALPTEPLGRTSLFFPIQEELFIAVPQYNGISAQLLTFQITNT